MSCNYRSYILPLLLTLAAATAALGQTGEITADPNAKNLRLLWQVEGKLSGGDYVGVGVGGLGDLYHDGRGIWAVLFQTAGEYRLYRMDSLGNMPTTPFLRYRLGGTFPVVGDFWGTGHNAVGFGAASVDTSHQGYTNYYHELHLFRSDSNRLDTVESAILNKRGMNPPQQGLEPDGIFAADLDKDGDDELILVMGGTGHDTTVAPYYVASPYPEIWIYKGGKEFQVDSPTVIVRDPERNGRDGLKVAVGDFDGDGNLDVCYILRKVRMTLYFGDGTVDGFTKPESYRVIELGEGYPNGLFGFITPLDCDGDGITDLAIDLSNVAPQGTYLYRSGTGKNARTRTYQLADADIVFPGLTGHRRGGVLNDSSRRYEMLAIREGSATRFFGGGPQGPDLKYDATSNHSALWSLTVTPIPDVNGDGWDDYIGGNYNVNFESGIAAVFGGGAYIPRDSAISGVEDIVLAGVRDAVSIWPNPVREELHIAWRGDLRRMPRHFHVYDALGQEVASGEVDAGTSAAIWHCAAHPAGIYLLSIYDANNSLITTTSIVKQ